MNAADRARMRADLEASAPEAVLSVRFHGSPAAIPQLPKRGSGAFVFRTWSRTLVSVSPSRPLTAEEYDRFLTAKRTWDAGSGFSISSGPSNEWPVIE